MGRIPARPAARDQSRARVYRDRQSQRPAQRVLASLHVQDRRYPVRSDHEAAAADPAGAEVLARRSSAYAARCVLVARGGRSQTLHRLDLARHARRTRAKDGVRMGCRLHEGKRRSSDL